MIDGAKVVVVVPARDEAAWIEQVVATMPAEVDSVVVVDDGSVDGTGELAAALGEGPPVEVLRHPRARGVGAAIVSGYRLALERQADVVAVMAGDGQMDPRDLPALLRAVASGRCDYAKGNRLRHPQVWRVMPRGRLAGTAALAWLTSLAAGVRVADSQCGYTAVSARALRAIDLDGLWPGYGYPNDLIGALAAAGMTIEDVVVRPVYRGERSGLRPWHALTIGWLVVRVAYRRWLR